MSTPLQPVITTAGLGAVLTADNTGVSARIGSIVVGTSGYTPDKSQKSLVSQVAEYPIAGGERLSSTMLHITALADDSKTYWVREIGFKLTDGTLLAVWSHPTEPLTYKAANSDLLLAYDLSLAALPADSVTIISNDAGLSLSLAGPLAAQANALLAEQLRGMRQQDLLTAQTEKQRIAGELVSNLIERMLAVEARQDADREAMLGATLSNTAAIMAGQLRGARQQEQIDQQAEAQRIAGEKDAELRARVKVVETRQDTDQSGLQEQGAALAGGLLAENLRGLQQQEALDSQARGQQANAAQIAALAERQRTTEQRQAVDYDGLATVAVANASAVISLQLQVTKMTHGV